MLPDEFMESLTTHLTWSVSSEIAKADPALKSH